MAKSQKLEALTTALHEIRRDPASEANLAALEQVIASRYGVAVAQAAQIVGDFELYALVPALVNAFSRFMTKPKDSDPGCRAKDAIAHTLYRLEYSDETLFLQGIRHVQLEPVWGGQVDTAPKLRGTCALGLVRMHYPGVMVELADLLADPEPEARIAAARAIAYSENDLGVALLRLRVKAGDTPAVLGECLAALLKLAPTESLALINTFLEAGRKLSDPDDAVEKADVAALVLGESRMSAALPLLQDWWRRTIHTELRRTALFAIATLRQDEALQFLLTLLTQGSARDAQDALTALSLHQSSEPLWQKVQAILRNRDDVALP